MKAATVIPLVRRRAILHAVIIVVAAGTLPMTGSSAFAQGAAAKPKIGMVGSGNVGSSLGRVWAKAGYEVMFSSQDLAADKAIAKEIGGKSRAGTPQEAVNFGDVLVFAVPYGALPDLGKTLGNSLKGKVVIDTSNPFPQRDGAIATEAIEKGAGITSARLLPGARIVRAFNAVSAARMGGMYQTPGKVAMPMASDDKQAIQVASGLIKDIGFVPVVVGGLAMGKFLMPGQPLAGEHTPDEIKKIAATLKP
jgi:8-hydroxy-5-deazaflavin:NADPH oxidoreductase